MLLSQGSYAVNNINHVFVGGIAEGFDLAWNPHCSTRQPLPPLAMDDVQLVHIPSALPHAARLSPPDPQRTAAPSPSSYFPSSVAPLPCHTPISRCCHCRCWRRCRASANHAQRLDLEGIGGHHVGVVQGGGVGRLRMARWRRRPSVPSNASCTTSVLTATRRPRHVPVRHEPRAWAGSHALCVRGALQGYTYVRSLQ